MSIPEDFPQFSVPGREKEMASLRRLYWLHYFPGCAPKATLWDIWLAGPGLWPAQDAEGHAANIRQNWRDVLSNRTIDSDGYVSTHQHASIAHPLGWPFPFWNQGQGGMGWHFSFKDTVGPPWRPDHLSTTEGWTLESAEDKGIDEIGWNLTLTNSHASVTTPEHSLDAFQSPFLQLRWQATGLGDAQPYVEWTTDDAPGFSAERRFYFDPLETTSFAHTAIPIYKHPQWKSEIRQIRIQFANPQPGAKVVIQALFSQYDTRHDVNGPCFASGCVTYFQWTRDLGFLRRNINRMRTALRYVMTEHHTSEQKVVLNDWVGHDGRSGLKLSPDGKKEVLSGHGIGDNYWDLLPMGHQDAYATVLYYHALRQMAQLEREVRAHPEWNVALGALQFDPDQLERHADEVKAVGNRLFWNERTGRFVGGVDADGEKHDFGLTFLNLEAIHYDFASPEHAESILSWISGERIAEDDTAKGADIYHWRFAPRATTKRNVEFYFWAWSGPESIPWGGQVQDGGAVLGFSYHDLMARLKTRGADDAWRRLQEIVKWFDEVQAAGGYREYYSGSREGTLQGGGTAGGLGLDCEFFESVLVPQVMLDGFLGFAPTADGFRIDPKLPGDWPELSIDRIRWHDLTLKVRATRDTIEVTKEGHCDEPCFVQLPAGDYKPTLLGADGAAQVAESPARRATDGAFVLDWGSATGVRFERK